MKRPTFRGAEGGARSDELLDALREAYGPQGWWPGGGEPFDVMLGAILVQRTTWVNAGRALDRLSEAGILDWSALRGLTSSTLEELIKPCGFYRTKAGRLRKLAEFVSASGGTGALGRLGTDALRERLLRLEGIGPETADAILLYAFDRPVFVVDAYARRLYSRLCGEAAPAADAELKRTVETAVQDTGDLNDLHALIVEHGKRHCRSSPLCAGCCLGSICRHAGSGLTIDPLSGDALAVGTK
jgi:endonuclease-3 related protein